MSMMSHMCMRYVIRNNTLKSYGSVIPNCLFQKRNMIIVPNKTHLSNEKNSYLKYFVISSIYINSLNFIVN